MADTYHRATQLRNKDMRKRTHELIESLLSSLLQLIKLLLHISPQVPVRFLRSNIQKRILLSLRFGWRHIDRVFELGEHRRGKLPFLKVLVMRNVVTKLHSATQFQEP
ncbi:hypothetical protein V8G54_030233 [Vigna mungo]|uniref:Uncharacterized protein n=1 Tax=Vigna mungo TaxID=3915 RepID=A0AAQ3RM77_VIGMU